MKFKEFIQESKENHAVLAFGRMNPPTTGHGKLVDKVKEVAKENNASHHVVLSHSQDKAKNPLSAESKLKHAKRFFPKTNLSVSDKEHPTFLHHAAKLHKQGVTHLHMIAGSDRVNEYKKKLAQYNGTHKDALYNFKKITVHSAGERDPDAEGTEGMSASKMRAHASSGNYKEFKKGVPSHVPEHHAKELYHDVRHHMGVKESVDASFEELLFEGVHDKAIFKAVFLAGGPGSGKDYVLDNTLAGHGLTEINSDKALEYLMDKKGLDKTMPASEKIERDVARGKAKSMSELRERLALHGRNGVIINGTGDDPEKIKRIKGRLEELGYDTSMIMVNTKDEVSAMRNVERGQRGGRTVPETIRKEKWQSVQNARPDLGKIFGDKYIEFDNSEDLRSAHPEIVKAKKKEMEDIYKQVQKFVNSPPKSKQAKEWVAAELEKKDTLTVSKKDAGASPHPNSKAAEEARQLGLDYYGFGRYGKDNKVTHRSVHDKLQPVQAPVAKKVNEEFENFLNETTEEINEGHDLNHKQLLKDKNGKVRTFMLRRSAAKEAHTHDGVVHQMGKGYVIKIKENENVTETIKPIQEERRTSSSSITERFRSAGASIRGTSGRSTSGANETITEGVAESKTKITLAQIRSKKEKAITEAIDMGIEPGLSMAQSGESLGRGAGDKYDKDGKLKPFKEMQGDETTASIGDQKEDELKKVGINLTSFRKRNYAV
jgi:nicotinamide mononucleotide adenylyltransferase